MKMKFKVATIPWRNKYKVKKCFEKSEFIKSNVLKTEKMKNHTWKLFFFSSSLINTSILIRSLDEVDEYSLVLDIVIATNENVWINNDSQVRNVLHYSQSE